MLFSQDDSSKWLLCRMDISKKKLLHHIYNDNELLENFLLTMKFG